MLRPMLPDRRRSRRSHGRGMRIRGSEVSGRWARAGLVAGAFALIFGTSTAGSALADQGAVPADTTPSTGTTGWQLAAASVEQNPAESWNGTTWVQQTTTAPAVTDGNSLAAVTCTSASDCTAVGQNFYNGADQSDSMAQVWDGTS
jgi:hypothetical protein